MSLVVPAAGCGARAALSGNKILAALHGRPLLWWTLHRLTRPDPFVDDEAIVLCEVVIAVRREERAIVRAIWDEVDSTLPLRLADGGATRQESVAAGVDLCNGHLVAVHDAARPLVSPELLARVARAALAHGAAIPALPASDTVKRGRPCEGVTLIEATLERDTIWLAQTPQVFRREILRAALRQAGEENFAGTDCASLVERWLSRSENSSGHVAIVDGDMANFKVTYAADLLRAEALLSV